MTTHVVTKAPRKMLNRLRTAHIAMLEVKLNVQYMRHNTVGAFLTYHKIKNIQKSIK